MHVHDSGAHMHVYLCRYIGFLIHFLRLVSWISICLGWEALTEKRGGVVCLAAAQPPRRQILELI
jgi:hypothetical protein